MTEDKQNEVGQTLPTSDPFAGQKIDQELDRQWLKRIYEQQKR